MRYRFACDCHNHSSCSPDGNDTVLEMRRRAQELGLWAHTLTDHCECQKFPERYRPRVERAWEKMALEIPQGGSTRFYRGIELGQPNQDLEAAEQALAGRDYDFVIGSIHNIRGYEDFFFLDYSKIERSFIDALLETYWQEELEVIRWGKFDSLGHLTTRDIHTTRFLSLRPTPCGISRATTASRWICPGTATPSTPSSGRCVTAGKPWR